MVHNMALSQRRAEAVVDDLASEHGIARSRLEAHGVGPLAPVATNDWTRLHPTKRLTAGHGTGGSNW
jgi:Outer membrane protein and related peptidoglycan-associated (lipo)proteins